MKQENGITLISLIIYVIGMTVIVAVMATISGYFYNNTKNMGDSIDPLIEYTRFISFFSNEMNLDNIKVLECKTTYVDENNESSDIINSYIVFDNGTQYTYINENRGIYRNNLKIAKKIEKCKFEFTTENGKNLVKVNMIVNGKERNRVYIII